MCNFVIGTTYNLVDRLFCKGCGTVAARPIGEGEFKGHDSGFDVFHLVKPVTCPWCDTVNEAVEKPCSDPIQLNVEQFELVDRHYN